MPLAPLPLATATAEVVVLDEPVWRGDEARHGARVDHLLAGHVTRARRGEKHPVEDFLFTYYSWRPSQLRRWHPGPGVSLRGGGERATWPGYRTVDGAVTLDVAGFLARRGGALARVRELLRATSSRPAQLGCLGLHEWAMVYRATPEAVRHERWPLRLGAAGTDAVVDGHRLRCSHVDAFRFFTPDAAPRNELTPTRESRVALEQPGCLHATMDLYKWAYKLSPATPSSLVLDAFELARDVRELDMRASPYDLRALGYDPVPIETAEGKATYVSAQRAFSQRGASVRARLLATLEQVMP